MNPVPVLFVSPRAVAALCALLLPCSVVAHDPSDTLTEELVVYGRAVHSIGEAQSASEGFVAYDDLRLAPLLRIGELTEAIPGMVATQHSGTGKANQYFLRGFNLDHGTDFAASVDGVPVNMRTHGHGQGYLDLNFLIPEVVATTRYQKGPYYAENGDFSSAGSVQFSLYESLPEQMLRVTVGEDDYYRTVFAGSFDWDSTVLTLAADANTYNGPWDVEEDLGQYRVMAGLAFDAGAGRARLGLQTYNGDWNSSDQIPQRAVDNGLISDTGFIDPDLGGKTNRYALTAGYQQDNFAVSAYVLDYDFQLFSNFTYLLDDPVEGDQFEQVDQRVTSGLELSGSLPLPRWGDSVNLNWGGDVRYDDIDEVGLYSTLRQQRNGTVRRDSAEELSVSAFAEVQFQPVDRLRATLGLRADYYDWDVDALQPANGGSGDDDLVSPKAGLAWQLHDTVETYANWGRGFHSNDVRGATLTEDPVSGDPAEAVDVLVESEGAEIGLRFEPSQSFNASLVGFWLELDSELVFVGDAGGTEVNGASERLGLEASLFWQATDWLALNADYTYTDSEFSDEPSNANSIPGAVESTFTLGANMAWANGWSGSMRLRYLGETPLIEDGSVEAEDSFLVNAGVSYRRGPLELSLEAFNLLDSDDYDIAYFYASRLPGEAAEGVEDIHFHPLEPRSLRASMSWFW